MSNSEITPERIKELIGQYWDIAHAEGRADRTHDTEAGDAQRVWIEIQSAIDRLAADLVLAVGERNRLQLKWDEFRQSKNAEVRQLRLALAWYADHRNYYASSGAGNTMLLDGGRQAAEALRMEGR